MSELEKNELFEKIQKGLKLSFKKLVLAKRKDNQPLIFSTPEGEIYEMNAKDIKV